MIDLLALIVDVAILIAVLFEAVVSWKSFKLRQKEAGRERRKVSRV